MSGGTLDTRCQSSLSRTGLSPSVVGFPKAVPLDTSGLDAGPNPEDPEGPPVWPPPLSLATTHGISVDVFSCPYLDVSVQGVPLARLFYLPCDN